MNVIQGGPTPVLAAAAAAATTAHREEPRDKVKPKTVKPAPKSEATARYAKPEDEVRGRRVDREA